MEVHSDMELEDFLLCVKSRLGVCDIAQLEQYDLTCQQWMVVTEAEDLELSDGAKYRVKSSHKQVCSRLMHGYSRLVMYVCTFILCEV